MSAQLAKDVAAWLDRCGGNRDIIPVRVSLTYGGRVYEYYGARYTWVGHYTHSMMAVTHGDKQEGEEYTRQCVYLVGDLPPTAKPKTRRGEHKVVYRLPDDDADWYISGYCQTFEPHQDKYHPFGKNWMLGRWDVPGDERIDRWDAGPRPRRPLAVEVYS